MRVLHIITGLHVGGAERALYNLLLGGLVDKFDNLVLSIGDKGVFGPKIEELGVDVTELGMRARRPTISGSINLRNIVRKFQPKLVQGWMYHGNLAASVCRWMAPVQPIIVWNIRQTLYGLKEEKFLTRQVIRANKLLSPGVDAILYNSRISREQHETFGFSDVHGHVIPNGFDLEVLHPDIETGSKIREEFEIPSGELVIGHVARFHPVKDHANFLRAAIRVADKFPKVHFIVVGRDVGLDNPVLSGLVPLRLRGRFHFPGERNDISAIMQAMDIFCLSSSSEAFPNVVGEAMATGIPCVVTEVGDVPELVGDAGIIVPSKNDKCLAEGLLKLLTMSTKDRSALGYAARKRIERYYNLPRVVEQYATLYQTLMEKKRCTRRAGE